MVVKSKEKHKAKSTVKSKAAIKAKSAGKAVAKPKSAKKIVTKTIVRSSSRSEIQSQVKTASSTENAATKPSARPVITTVVKRTLTPMVDRQPPIKRSLRVNQFAFMKAPGLEHAFEVGDNVEVFCDHEKSRERVRGWIKGIVVQVDNKMVAVQFRSNVYLTDGWMVPDRILWYPLTSEHIRPLPGKKPAAKKEYIPDY